MSTICPVPVHVNVATTATATSTYPGYSASAAIDGNHAPVLNQGWTNGSVALPQTLELSWAAARPIGRIDLTTTTGYEARDYDLDVWNGSAWINVAQVRDNTSTTVVSRFAPISATKARLVGLKGPAVQAGYVRVNELEVFANLAQGSASSTYPGYSANHVNDGNRSSVQDGTVSWTNTGGAPQWVELQWPACRAFDEVLLFTSAGYEIKDYDVEAWDGAAWVKVDSVQGNVATSHRSVFSLLSTDRVRILGLSGPAIQP